MEKKSITFYKTLGILLPTINKDYKIPKIEEFSDEKSFDELDFLDTDARVFYTIEQQEERRIWALCPYNSNCPKSRYHYERTGNWNIKFRGASSFKIKLNDINKENINFINKQKTVLNINDPFNKFIFGNNAAINTNGKRKFTFCDSQCSKKFKTTF